MGLGAGGATAAAGLFTLVWLLYRKVLRLWWTFDDAYLLHIAATHIPRQYFLDPNVWREMPQHLFTPLLTLTYDSELSLFGFTASGYYAVQLALLAAAALALYGTLQLYVARRYAFAGALLFIAGVPIGTLATELMLVHYTISIVLGTIAAALFILSVRATPTLVTTSRDAVIDVHPQGESRRAISRAVLLSVASALVYLLAMLAKEVAVPLVLVLPMLPDRGLRTRIRLAVPHVIALLVYLAWRWRMLGELLGGYGWAITPSEWPRLILILPFSMIRVFADSRVTGWLMVAVTGIGIGGLYKRRGALAITLAAFILAVYPVLPVSKEMQPRFAVVAWLCWSVAFIAGTWTLRQHGTRVFTAALLIAATLLCLIGNRIAFARTFATSREMSDEARFFVDAPPDVLLLRPAIPAGSMGEVQWLKTGPFRQPAGALAVYDELYLCSQRSGRRIFRYDKSLREVRDITSSENAYAAQFCGQLRETAPLSANFSYRDGSLFWTLGPYREGTYRFVLANGLLAYDMRRVDGFRLGSLPGITLRIRYDSPVGWTTYSPELTMQFDRNPDMSWHR